MGQSLTKYANTSFITDDALRNTNYKRVLVIGEDHVVPYDQYRRTLLIRQQASWSGGDHEVVDANTQQILYRSSGKVFSCKELELLDARTGVPIVTVRSKDPLGDYASFDICRPANEGGELLMRIKVRRHAEHSTLEGTFVCESARHLPPLVVKAGFVDMFFFLGHPAEHGVLIGRMDAERHLRGSDTMSLTVVPGVDAALLVSICVLADFVQRTDDLTTW
ncbi:hypothetical protein AMAG_01511 [Allomyces macrogynus ATCC 38327]|uniref:Tubby C-terminal domain-containing protein n=1 Tax=Allomyces macrogynus (strain ATCC 38327) TaxID=578462 RepID=A0A0L0RZY2_ALLM3|nr:hypothetical protein AMAG_01511 [Allomyces macrogynus ATCC 38327]|eukprot:KNE55624.1 hypothetical protein AMAG_01511 [Allomyces macrogynus ATCC 38327]